MNSRMIDTIKISEGFRGMPYTCPSGCLTIGFGTKLPISEEEATLLLEYRLKKTEKALARRIPGIWGNAPEAVRNILADMSYNLGVGGLLKFKKTLKHIEAGDYVAASVEMLRSKWALQTGSRAIRLSEKMAKCE